MGDTGVDSSFNSSSGSVFAKNVMKQAHSDVFNKKVNSRHLDRNEVPITWHLDRNEIPITRHLHHHEIPHVIPKALRLQQNSYHWAFRS